MSELNEMGCDEFADVGAELALGVLTGRERAAALAHLDRCDRCRENVRQLTMTGEELLGLLPVAEPPAGFETRVMERLGLVAPSKAPVGQVGRARHFGRELISSLTGKLRKHREGAVAERVVRESRSAVQNASPQARHHCHRLSRRSAGEPGQTQAGDHI